MKKPAEVDFEDRAFALLVPFVGGACALMTIASVAANEAPLTLLFAIATAVCAVVAWRAQP